MQGYYSTQPTYDQYSPESAATRTPGSHISCHTLPPAYCAQPNVHQVLQVQLDEHNLRDTHHDTSQSGTRVDNPGPDSDFIQTLHSISATPQSAGRDHTLRGICPSESETVVAETIVRARKSWKTVKGCNEPVWPPELERVLVQALLSYRPDDAQFARALGRFPKRNRYISDYIYNTTGIRRTPKQVGSRLQQLKDVSCGKMLLNHVASWAQVPSAAAPIPSQPSGEVPSQEPPSDYESILDAAHGYTPGSDGSQSPATPIGCMDQGSPFLSASTSSEQIPHPYSTHPQTVYSHGDWLAYNLPISSQL